LSGGDLVCGGGRRRDDGLVYNGALAAGPWPAGC
jgi:hypothetical protein